VTHMPGEYPEEKPNWKKSPGNGPRIRLASRWRVEGEDHDGTSPALAHAVSDHEWSKRADDVSAGDAAEIRRGERVPFDTWSSTANVWKRSGHSALPTRRDV
jgi:hypothetical protein